ncbi:ABC transporter ATP-binding protein [Clostridium manihotivorum]|uniref:Multidrug ABC transporter ATP-binding protein n=1 Tax=Clostridium manihotivorum TaxID=2320868 RepID=A0A410DXK0_9CLOT|nr:ABC transporter ATP-binding protein [Clostridium manihotivorum]QAA33785.1 multidrug ABC transporter ATP-binding protein [Clostridium manihotivorum]
MCILKANNISKIYGGVNGENSTKALNNVDLNIEPGEFLGIMGPSGSGKTTLLNILSGIDKANSGYVSIDGKRINDMDKNQLALFRRKRLGFVFQDFNLLDSLTARENIMLPMILDKCTEEYMNKKVEEVLEVFDIKSLANKYPYNISGGQKQRVAIARAIINTPSIIFGDEPTGNLDSKSSKSVMECLEKLNKEEKNTILLVTHDVSAASYCNRVIFLKDGAISYEAVKKGTRREFFNELMNYIAVLGGDGNDF